MILYPLIAVCFVVVGHTAYKIANVFEKPEDAPKILKEIGRFFFLWAAIVVAAAFAGHYAFRLPVGF
jgi:hypothetical protein